MPSEASPAARPLNDIRAHILLIEQFVAGFDEDRFHGDPLRFHAVTRCLEIISEASRRLPDALKARHPDVSWKAMAGAGNIYRHDYEDVAASYVWVTVKDHLPRLRLVVELELAPEAPATPSPPRPPLL